MATKNDAAQNAAAAQAANESVNVVEVATSEKCVLNVTGIRLIEQDGTANVAISFDTPIDGYKVVDGVRTRTNVTSISVPAKHLKKCLYDENKLVKKFRAAQKNSLNEEQLGIILDDARIVVVRNWHAAGEPNNDLEGKFFSKDCFTTDIEKIVLDEDSLDFVKQSIRDIMLNRN